MSSGYCDCSCRDCFEIAIADDTKTGAMCHACEEAGCEPDSECQAPQVDEEIDRAEYNRDGAL